MTTINPQKSISLDKLHINSFVVNKDHTEQLQGGGTPFTAALVTVGAGAFAIGYKIGQKTREIYDDWTKDDNKD